MCNFDFFKKIVLLALLLLGLSADAQIGAGYFVRFPDDVYKLKHIYGQPLGEAPEVLADPAVSNISMSFVDDTSFVVPDACYRINRTWTIIDLNTFDPGQSCISVPNPNPNSLPIAVENLHGPLVAPAGTPAPWTPSEVALTPGGQELNFSIFWSASPNCYQYTQVIKVIDSQDPVSDCPLSGNLSFNDPTDNDSMLWNQPNFFDPNLGLNDLYEGAAELSVTAADSSDGANLRIRYLLFLDLDYDGSMETVVNSETAWSTPAGSIYTGNAGNPNFAGGILKQFDSRPTPPGWGFKFSKEEAIINGPLPTKKATVRWSQDAAPNQFSVPQIPHGTHKIKWIVEDNCGNERVCEYTFKISNDGFLTISGSGFLDKQADCTFDPATEPTIPEQSVVAVAYPSLQSSTVESDAAGQYSLVLPAMPGDTAVVLSIGSNPACPTLISIDPLQTSYHRDLAVPLSGDCPNLHVDIATPMLRRCFENNWVVSFYNSGLVDATDAYVEVDFDPFLEVKSASVPHVLVTGNKYRFDLQTIESGSKGSFSVKTLVSCDATLGQTHCSEAHIFPDTLCPPGGQNWNGAWVVARAWCDGDSVRLSLKNRGAADMTETLEFIVIEDVIMYRQGVFQLPAGDSLVLSMPAFGDTWRIESEQVPGFPFPDNPSATLEGCGGIDQLGLVNMLPHNDAADFVDIFCLQNVGSFDPNDKTAFPEGYGTPHFIYPNTGLEYLIRFQNTGTDTAFRVVVVDTLSENLDWATLRLGASSHPYRLDAFPGGVLRFVFDPILLPDSNVNEAASHGFLKFRIAQLPDLGDGTLLENRASIYFDFNEPVHTNAVWHTVGTDFIEVVPTEEPSSSACRWRVSPNPFSNRAEFIFENLPSGEALFLVTDVLGKKVAERRFSGGQLAFENQGLSAGVYFFRVMVGGQTMAVGKLTKR